MSESTSFVQLFVGFFLSAAGVHASCPIELSPPSVVVRYGDPVSINCSTSESLFRGMGWEASQGGTGLEKVKRLTWTVERLTEWTISPLCFLNPLPDSPFEQCSMNPKVVLYTFPETISISSSSDLDGVMREKEEYDFTCHIQNIAPVQNLTVRWYKGDTIFHTETFNNPSKEPVDQSSVLSFRPTREDNGVTFRCEAHLDLGPEGPQFNISSQEYNITVNFGPHIQCSAPELLEGETLEKKCPVIGNPTPFVQWLKKGQPIDPTIPLRRGDAGNYTVSAEGHSFIKKTFLVPVLYGPELMCPSTYTAVEHVPHNLICTVEGYPQPETTWYKDGEEVELPESLTRSHQGQYLITASNSLSTVNVIVDIIVTYPPSQIVELEDSEVDIGSTVSLKCSSMGNPRPKYFWNYYRTDNVMEKNEDGVSRLLIQNATAYNVGSYTCHAWNDRGNVSKTARVTVKGAKQECPIEITPDRMVIQYQSRGQTATCTPTSTGSMNKNGEIYWQAQKDFRTNGTTWLVDTHKDWDPRPVCTATFKGIGPCQKHLSFTLYKTPDSVSIRSVVNSSSVLEEREFQLQCDITNVAPARNLAVRWYRGNETIETLNKTSMRVTGCLSENNTKCDISVVRSPVNVSSTINVTLNRKQNGADLRCEAQLDLGPEGPQPPPIMMSSPLNITIYYKPIINTTKLPKRIPVFRGYPEELICEADGHPPPQIQWIYSPDKARLSGDTLTVFEAGFYNCSATNEVDSISFEVEVILKGKPVSSSCPVEMSPPAVVVRFGDPFSVNCHSSSNQTAGMGWESSYGGTGLQTGVTSVPLNINSVKGWDMRPLCFINLLNRQQCVNTLPVTVYKMPDSVLMSQASQMVQVVEGQAYSMQCDIVNVAPVSNLSVRWHKGNHMFHTDSFIDSTLYPVNKSSSISLTAHRDDNGTQIWCEAELDFKSTGPILPAIQSAPREVIVQYPPVFTTPGNETLELPAGSKIVLNCTAAGNPTPVYSWQFPHPMPAMNKDQNENEPILTPSFQLPGTYTCTASNHLGYKTKHITVIEAPRNRTTFAALVGGFLSLGVLLVIVGIVFVTPEGTFSFSKGSYLRGRPTSSGPV